MLVLTREIGQSITIDHDIIVKILGVDRRGKFRLGIDAPRHRQILRDDAVNRERKESKHAD